MFGDAFLENKSKARNGLLPWTFIVLNHTLQRTVAEQDVYFKGFSSTARGIVSDVALIFRRSRHIFKLFQKVLTTSSSSQVHTYIH